jgi:hypothetical protein
LRVYPHNAEELSSREDSMRVLLRLKDVPDLVGVRLLRAHHGSPVAEPGDGELHKFVNVKLIEINKDNEAQVDLIIDTEFTPDEELRKSRLPNEKPKVVEVTREMLDVLWDLLEIFPRKA